jgi:NADH dehydrogenase
MRTEPAQPDAPHVIIVGAGFGGLSAVGGLRKAGMRVTIVDRNLYSTFQPLLYQVATGGLNPGDISYPVGGFAVPRQARYIRGDLATIDATGRRVTLADGRELSYDYLILATGVSAAHFGVKGAAEYTCGLYTRADAIVLRDRIMNGFERLSEYGGEFAITVVGGGATGVELAGTLAELRGAALSAAFPDVNPSGVRVRLVEMAPSLLMPFHPSLREYASRQLAQRGVDIRLGTRILEVQPDCVVLAEGQSLPSDLTVWAAGISGPPAVAAWNVPQGKGGRILVGPDLQVQGHDRIFAVGDIALNPNDPVPQLAQPALQEGRHAAAQIARLARGEQTKPFSYHDKGIMATIGRRSAVVQLARGPRVTGTPAWFAWLGLHLVYLLGYRNRVTTLINLSWRYIAWRHGGGVIVGEEPAEALPSARTPAALPSPADGDRTGALQGEASRPR